MITSIQIKNFKSVVDLSFELGSFNVLIGENGCGKSNILEAIAFGAAASADKLDYEFLGSRAIRVSNPEFMFSAFANEKKERAIDIDVKDDEHSFKYSLTTSKSKTRKWKNIHLMNAKARIFLIFDKALKEKNAEKRKDILESIGAIHQNDLLEITDQFHDELDVEQILDDLATVHTEKSFSNQTIANYIIYSPEQSSLRKFEETNQIYPLGIKGEGLFQYLKELAASK
ncbi:MAG: AAA family ATPase [Chitinophagaceae bacterium]